MSADRTPKVVSLDARRAARPVATRAEYAAIRLRRGSQERLCHILSDAGFVRTADGWERLESPPALHSGEPHEDSIA